MRLTTNIVRRPLSMPSDRQKPWRTPLPREYTAVSQKYFGEIALLRQKTRSATVRCTKALDLLALPQGQFQALITNLPDLKSSFESVMDSRMKREADANRA